VRNADANNAGLSCCPDHFDGHISQSEQVVTRVGNCAVVDVKVSDVVEVSLDENPTTGYRWAMEGLDEAILGLEVQEFISSSDAGVGGGGSRTLCFRVISPGTASIILKKWREWDANSSVLDPGAAAPG
jgi:inhibitor of cysteine peptidase